MKKNITINEQTVEYQILTQDKDIMEVSLNNKTFKVKVIKQSSDGITFELNGKNIFVPSAENYYSFQGQNYKITSSKNSELRTPKRRGESSMVSPMPGKILKLFIAQGMRVKKGDALLVMEAMKMEHTIKAIENGVVKKILYCEGDQVEGGVDLFDFEQG